MVLVVNAWYSALPCLTKIRLTLIVAGFGLNK